MYPPLSQTTPGFHRPLRLDRASSKWSCWCARACNHELNRLLPMAAPAAILQQTSGIGGNINKLDQPTAARVWTCPGHPRLCQTLGQTQEGVDGGNKSGQGGPNVVHACSTIV